MAIKPSDFDAIVVQAIERYHPIRESTRYGLSNGLISNRSSLGFHEITHRIKLPNEHQEILKMLWSRISPEILVVGVEYPVAHVYNGSATAVVEFPSHPTGIISHGYWDGHTVASFDLEQELLTSVKAHHNAKAKNPLVLDKTNVSLPLEDGVKAFLADVYAHNGIRL